ncbi:MAG TPA: dTDP-4-dehydrorhamnose reductase [Jatrophihabitans sp.]|nr:dTDP-4-dehydrorhamnose reductase [Jatrophihabitans sp.]
MTRWLVTGAGGQLGHHVVHRLRAAGDDVVALTRHDLDITRPDDVEAAIAAHRPDVVINTAAYTAVDAAETDEHTAALVNGTAPGVIAAAVDRHGGRLLHVSTDYVFDGTAHRPYEVDDPVGPRSAYGRTKLAGERAVRAALPERGHIVRTAWVYGGPGPNFVDTMRRLERERDTLDVVDDQIGSPTWVGDLAGALIELGRADVAGGVLHYACAGTGSWCDLARETFRLVGADPARVRPVGTDAFPRPAPRPAWSVLSTRSWTDAGLTPPRAWQAALAESLGVAVS